MEQRPADLLTRPAHEESLSRALAPMRRRSLSEGVVDQLLEYIAEGNAPERRLPVERVLCEQLDVSRTTVREALATLIQVGVVETRGKGRFGSLVGARAYLASRARSRSSETELVDHPLEARRVLEPAIAALAAERASEADLEEIARWLTLMREAGARGQDNVRYDSGFHAAIARATGNPTLVFLINALTDALAESRRLSFQPGTGAMVAIEGHAAILEALSARDARAAAMAMQHHLEDVGAMIRSALEDHGGEGAGTQES